MKIEWRSFMKIRNWLMVLTGTLVLPASMASAQSGADAAETETVPIHPALTKPLFLAAGVYYPTSATNALLAPSGGGTGVGVDFEDTLGLSEREATGIVSARWRFAEKWRLEAEYFGLKRSATRTLATEIEWGDTTYPVGTAVDSTFDITDTRLAVGYTFFKRKDKEIGVGQRRARALARG
jgi:hypothetical protein